MFGSTIVLISDKEELTLINLLQVSNLIYVFRLWGITLIVTVFRLWGVTLIVTVF